MGLFGIGSKAYVVKWKDRDGNEQSEGFDTYPDALNKKQDLNKQKIYAWVEKG